MKKGTMKERTMKDGGTKGREGRKERKEGTYSALSVRRRIRSCALSLALILTMMPEKMTASVVLDYEGRKGVEGGKEGRKELEGRMEGG